MFPIVIDLFKEKKMSCDLTTKHQVNSAEGQIYDHYHVQECLTNNLWKSGQQVVHVTPIIPALDLLATSEAEFLFRGLTLSVVVPQLDEQFETGKFLAISLVSGETDSGLVFEFGVPLGTLYDEKWVIKGPKKYSH